MKKYRHSIEILGKIAPTAHCTTTAVVASKYSGKTDRSEIEINGII